MSKSHPRWRMAKRVLTVLFFIAVIVLLVIYAQKVDWQDVWKVIRGYDRLALFSAIALVIVSYLIYGCYDLLGRAYCGHKLAKRQVMLVSFICYAFNLTLSTWVGGIGMRYRLYSRLGLNGSTITRIFSLSITTNWLGYILLGGVIFTADLRAAAALVHQPDHSAHYRRVMLILTLCYLFGCGSSSKRRHLTIKGQRLVPSQLSCAAADGALGGELMAMGAIIWLLLGSEINYFLVLVLLVSSIAGVIIHIPADRRAGGGVYRHASGEDISEGRDHCRPAWRALSYYFRHCCWRRWLICRWRAGRKAAAKEPAQAGPRSEMKRFGRKQSACITYGGKPVRIL